MKGDVSEAQFVEALATVMRQRDIPLDRIRGKGKAPKGTWIAVGELTGQSKAAAGIYWTRSRDKLLPQLESLLSNVDRVDLPGDEPQATREPVIVDKIDIPEEPTEPAKDDMVDRIDDDLTPDAIVDKDDKIDKCEVQTMLEAMEARLMQTIEARISAAMAGTTQAAKVDNYDMPPMPPKIGAAGKQFAGRKSDLRARVDSELMKLLESQAREHFSGNMSRCLDAVLWHYFNKPRLSFEDVDD